MEYTGKARSDHSIVIGDKGLISAKSLRLFFGVDQAIPELERGQVYRVSLELMPSAEEQAAIDEDLKGLTKLELTQKLMALRKPELAQLVGQSLYFRDLPAAEDVPQEPAEPVHE